MHSLFTSRKLHLAALAVAVLASSPALAQSGTRSYPSQYPSQSPSGSRSYPSYSSGSGVRVVQKPVEVQFWEYLQRSHYRNWAPAPGQGIQAYEGQSPHGAYLKMYLNRTAIADVKGLPHKSVIVKENFGADGKTLMAVTVMYRSQGYDPQHNDWYWVKYNPNGTVARGPAEMGGKPLMGRVAGCIKCHGGAGGGDFTFFND